MLGFLLMYINLKTPVAPNKNTRQIFKLLCTVFWLKISHIPKYDYTINYKKIPLSTSCKQRDFLWIL